ncbi:hypothetical protein RH831_11090 [Halodesulfurarchaeum sp. HSR-GB]|uniref:DUF6788 family protein n=1 Tax=Halodesulfurarchaeum sp. HSR-GB TaxID=3074077 RepID=UPI002854F264|nr:DUF6788 family protein [Halodesulfurarchaeum sp. HSR-GB]MDR5657720.1 hypothetical protein [Halodesulfurarchaeum sp. HSR-GB]
MEHPSAPASLPKYLAEGLPKQDDSTLRDTQAYIEDLLEARNEPIKETELPDTAEVVETDSKGKGSVVKEKVKCGDESCHCADGEQHGPYLYRYWKENGKTRSEYVGKP